MCLVHLSQKERKELITEFIKVSQQRSETPVFFNPFKISKPGTQFKFFILHWLSHSLRGHSGSEVVDTLHPSSRVKGPSGRCLFLNFAASENHGWVLQAEIWHFQDENQLLLCVSEVRLVLWLQKKWLLGLWSNEIEIKIKFG